MTASLLTNVQCSESPSHLSHEDSTRYHDLDTKSLIFLKSSLSPWLHSGTVWATPRLGFTMGTAPGNPEATCEETRSRNKFGHRGLNKRGSWLAPFFASKPRLIVRAAEEELLRSVGSAPQRG